MSNTTPPTSEQCSICLDNIDTKNKITTACGHTFHASCIFQNLRLRNTCPLCRTPLIEPQYESDSESEEIRIDPQLSIRDLFSQQWSILRGQVDREFLDNTISDITNASGDNYTITRRLLNIQQQSQQSQQTQQDQLIHNHVVNVVCDLFQYFDLMTNDLNNIVQSDIIDNITDTNPINIINSIDNVYIPNEISSIDFDEMLMYV